MPLACFGAISNLCQRIRNMPKACPYAMVLSWGGLFDEMGVLHVVEPGVEEADLGDYWQGEE